MDENKRAVLKEIDYQIHGVCGLCQHGAFEVDQDWGTCQVHTYDHLKHSLAQRPLSINTYGSCPSFEWDIATALVLGKFSEFQQPQPPTLT